MTTALKEKQTGVSYKAQRTKTIRPEARNLLNNLTWQCEVSKPLIYVRKTKEEIEERKIPRNKDLP